MAGLESLVPGARVRGLDGSKTVEVVSVEWYGNAAVNVTFRGDDGPRDVIVYRDTEPRLEIVDAGRAFSFNGDGETYRIASETQRIRLAHLFDPYIAIHSSRIEPPPHQITWTAV
jgi:hypothetical protein